MDNGECWSSVGNNPCEGDVEGTSGEAMYQSRGLGAIECDVVGCSHMNNGEC